MTTSDLNRLQKSFNMPTASGICTQEVDHPESQTPYFGGIRRPDFKIFPKHSSIETWDKQHEDTSTLLRQVGADWMVDSKPLTYFHGGELLTFDNVQNWHQTDNGKHLGTYSDKRHPVDPTDVVNYMRQFCDESDKQITMDVITYLKDQKRIICGCKIKDVDAPMTEVGDESDHFLMLTCDYGQAKAMKVFTYHHELACTNGQTKRIVADNQFLSHRKVRSYREVQEILKIAFETCKEYGEMKDKLIHAKVSNLEARNFIRKFFRDKDGLNDIHQQSQMRNVNIIERLFEMPSAEEGGLRGGHLACRQGNAYRLQQAFTEFTTHHRKAKSEEYRFSQKLGGRLSNIDNKATDLILATV